MRNVFKVFFGVIVIVISGLFFTTTPVLASTTNITDDTHICVAQRPPFERIVLVDNKLFDLEPRVCSQLSLYEQGHKGDDVPKFTYKNWCGSPRVTTWRDTVCASGKPAITVEDWENPLRLGGSGCLWLQDTHLEDDNVYVGNECGFYYENLD